MKHEQRLVFFKQCFISILFFGVGKKTPLSCCAIATNKYKTLSFLSGFFREVQTWRCGKGLQIWRESLRGTSVRCLQDQSLERTGPARERSAGQMGGKGMNETMGLLGTATMMWGGPL